MIETILFVIFIAAISAAFSYTLDFGLGYPGKKEVEEINTKAALFGWSFHLAAKKFNQTYLRKTKAIYNIPLNKGLEQELAERQFKTDIFAQGRELFTWEFAFGMCIYCTNFWLSLIFAAVFYFTSCSDWIIFITTPAFAHLILRKL